MYTVVSELDPGYSAAGMRAKRLSALPLTFLNYLSDWRLFEICSHLGNESCTVLIVD